MNHIYLLILVVVMSVCASKCPKIYGFFEEERYVDLIVCGDFMHKSSIPCEQMPKHKECCVRVRDFS